MLLTSKQERDRSLAASEEPAGPTNKHTILSPSSRRQVRHNLLMFSLSISFVTINISPPFGKPTIPVSFASDSSFSKIRSTYCSDSFDALLLVVYFIRQSLSHVFIVLQISTFPLRRFRVVYAAVKFRSVHAADARYRHCAANRRCCVPKLTKRRATGRTRENTEGAKGSATKSEFRKAERPCLHCIQTL